MQDICFSSMLEKHSKYRSLIKCDRIDRMFDLQAIRIYPGHPVEVFSLPNLFSQGLFQQHVIGVLSSDSLFFYLPGNERKDHAIGVL